MSVCSHSLNELLNIYVQCPVCLSMAFHLGILSLRNRARENKDVSEKEKGAFCLCIGRSANLNEFKESSSFLAVNLLMQAGKKTIKRDQSSVILNSLWKAAILG